MGFIWIETVVIVCVSECVVCMFNCYRCFFLLSHLFARKILLNSADHDSVYRHSKNQPFPQNDTELFLSSQKTKSKMNQSQTPELFSTVNERYWRKLWPNWQKKINSWINTHFKYIVRCQLTASTQIVHFFSFNYLLSFLRLCTELSQYA